MSRAMPTALKPLRADDEKIDVQYTAVFRELLTYMMEDPRNITACTHLLFCAKNLERIGDHVTNIAENAYYVVTGDAAAGDRPKLDETAMTVLAGMNGRRRQRMIAPKIMVVEDEEPLVRAAQLQSRGRGLSGRDRHARRRGRDPAAGERARPAGARLDGAGDLRHRALPPAAHAAETERLPIIMLTARGEESDRVRGLSTGADDYLVKPFSTPEFMARVKALLRRAKPEVLSSVLKVGDIVLDREAHRVYRKKSEIQLGPTEFRLLEFMMQHPGRVFSRSQLLDNVWGETIYIDERTVDVHVGRLRKAVNNGRMPDVIRTIRGAGYAIREA